jgi:hypothetical protein
MKRVLSAGDFSPRLRQLVRIVVSGVALVLFLVALGGCSGDAPADGEPGKTTFLFFYTQP